MNISIIAAVSKNQIIGKDNQLVWNLPKDMKYFSNVTKGHSVIMGRRNWDSIPKKWRPLPQRKNIILSKNKELNIRGATVTNTIEEAIEILTDNVEYAIESEGTISITSYVSTDWFHPADQEESSKFLSADIVNYYIERLNILNVKLKSEHASFQRAFIEERYNQNIYY